jgi:hypothetical protein
MEEQNISIINDQEEEEHQLKDGKGKKTWKRVNTPSKKYMDILEGKDTSNNSKKVGKVAEISKPTIEELTFEEAGKRSELKSPEDWKKQMVFTRKKLEKLMSQIKTSKEYGVLNLGCERFMEVLKKKECSPQDYIHAFYIFYAKCLSYPEEIPERNREVSDLKQTGEMLFGMTKPTNLKVKKTKKEEKRDEKFIDLDEKIIELKDPKKKEVLENEDIKKLLEKFENIRKLCGEFEKDLKELLQKQNGKNVSKLSKTQTKEDLSEKKVLIVKFVSEEDAAKAWKIKNRNWDQWNAHLGETRRYLHNLMAGISKNNPLYEGCDKFMKSLGQGNLKGYQDYVDKYGTFYAEFLRGKEGPVFKQEDRTEKAIYCQAGFAYLQFRGDDAFGENKGKTKRKTVGKTKGKTNEKK